MSNQNQQTKVAPPHKSEKQFRRYELHIASLLSGWPHPLVIDPAPLSASTFSARMRAAIASILEFGWTTTIDVDILRARRTELEIGVNAEGLVVCGKKGATKALALAGKVTEALRDSNFVATVDKPDAPTVHALAFLLSRKVLSGAAKFTNLEPAIRTQVASQYDVAFADESGFVVMV